MIYDYSTMNGLNRPFNGSIISLDPSCMSVGRSFGLVGWSAVILPVIIS